MGLSHHHLHGVARTALVAALAGSGLGAGLVAPAQAQEAATQQHDYRIAPGPLDEVLTQFGRASGILLSFSSGDTAGLRSAGLQGRHSVRGGLDALLAGSGLAALAQPNGAYVLRKTAAPAPAAAASGSSVLREVRVTAQAERSATTEASGSLAARATSINKGEQALKDIPQSVSVLTRKQLDEQGITDLKVAANSITGMVGAQGVGQGMVLSARGFQIDAWQYDGVPVPRNHYALGNWATEGMVFYDRMEVLRGASGLLQGTGSPGGAVNLVRKRGQAHKTVTVTTRAGSWERYGVQLDAGGPLNAEGSLRGRVVLDEARNHSFIDYVNERTHSQYAALDYDLSPDTTIGLGVSRADSKGRPMLLGLPVYPDGKETGLPRSTFTGAVWNRSHIAQTTWFADLSHRFNADWKLKAAALRMGEQNSSTHQRMTGDPALNPDGSGLSYDNWITDFDSTRVGLDVYVNGRFDALGLRHEVTVGANYAKYTTNDMFARTFTSGANIFAIDHHRPMPTVDSLLADGGRQTLSSYDVRQHGIYTSWRARLSDPLTAIVGARASWYDNIYTNLQTGSRSGDSASAEITPYVGLVYALTPQWSAYGSATSVFEPQSSRTVAGSVLDPVIGTNYEIGLKGELLNGRVNTSVAAFRYDHKNRAVNDVASGMVCDGWYCSTSSGKVRSQGVEAEVSGEVLRKLQVMAGYTYNTTKYLSDPVEQGQVFSTWTPRNIVRAWASYQLPGAWSQLTVGGGFSTQSHTLSTERSFKVPGFTVWNLRLGYQITPELGLAMNLNNVFDKHYVQPGFIGYVGATYGDPRNVMFTLKYQPKL